MASNRRNLTVFDRSMIEVRLRDGLGIRAIARELGRSSGTISDEINRHGGASAYQADAAAARAEASRARCGRKPRLAHDGVLFGQVTALLRRRWSPEQISGRRKRMEAGVEQTSGLTVSHEAIYTAIYAVPRGELRRELISCLRQDKPMRGRKPKGSERRGKLVKVRRPRRAQTLIHRRKQRLALVARSSSGSSLMRAGILQAPQLLLHGGEDLAHGRHLVGPPAELAQVLSDALLQLQQPRAGGAEVRDLRLQLGHARLQLGHALA